MDRILHSTAMGAAGIRSAWLRSARVRRGSGEQVAAVCYRMCGGGIEFLLVQSRGGRWIFPKGSIEAGLTHAQSAALEAFEEAGVHGRIEETSFARYVRRERGGKRSSRKTTDGGILVHAHLCEVRGLDRPQESNRKRTWFTAEKAKRRLQEDRDEDFGIELARVVDRALSRIERLRGFAGNAPEQMHRDALRTVCLEKFGDGHLRGAFRDAALARYYLGRRTDAHPPGSIGVATPTHALLQSGGPEENRRVLLRLGTGTGSTAVKRVGVLRLRGNFTT